MERSVGDKVEELMVHGNKWKMARALPRSRSGDQETYGASLYLALRFEASERLERVPFVVSPSLPLVFTIFLGV